MGLAEDAKLDGQLILVVDSQPFARATFNPTVEHSFTEIAQPVCHVQSWSLCVPPFVSKVISVRFVVEVEVEGGERWFSPKAWQKTSPSQSLAAGQGTRWTCIFIFTVYEVWTFWQMASFLCILGISSPGLASLVSTWGIFGDAPDREGFLCCNST